MDLKPAYVRANGVSQFIQVRPHEIKHHISSELSPLSVSFLKSVFRVGNRWNTIHEPFVVYLFFVYLMVKFMHRKILFKNPVSVSLNVPV